VTLNRRGLALIDEPETHLHPPLLAALMAGVRRLLDDLQAYAIVATHSPVVAQENLASQVKIISGGREGVFVRDVPIQTFGENVGTLTREIFGLHTKATDYRAVLEQMANDLGSAEAIERRLGQPLSSQALAHVLATLGRAGA
jgi:predicted ATP-binding protein involved in virulence